MTSSTDFSSKFPPFHTGTFLSQFFWLFIIFGFFYWIMHRFILPRLYFIMETRRNQILSDQDKMNAAKKEINDVAHSYEQLLMTAHKEAKEIINKAVVNAENNLDYQKKLFDKDLSDKLLRAQNKIDEIKEKSSKEIHFIVEEITKDLAKKIGFSVSDSEVQSTIKKVLNREGNCTDVF
ncbi:F0F1 ATP synthase subunit B family protein [Candidatus Liberibacter brunswickensis]|uniref:F0F1 ATP synthase subunit B family protein n=1 Tax=Candidatus Liberibacter brunswickensis TaxID=1968796 RepID=UPI002FE25D42